MSLRRTLVALSLVASSALVALPAQATLTPSELAQIREAVSSPKGTASAGRLRSLIARPDLTDEESASALTQAVTAVQFNEARAALLKDLVFGSSSTASRPLLVTTVVKALVARADAVLNKNASTLDTAYDATNELKDIYAFIDRDIANAAGRRATSREAQAQNGISLAAYEECSRVLQQHAERHAKWLRGESKLAPAPGKVRAQLKLAVLDLLPDSPTVRVEAADRLGLAGARRSFFTELGILPLDNTGGADDARIDRVRAFIARLPSLREGTSAIYFGESKPDLVARGSVLAIGSSLEGGASSSAVPPSARENPFPEDVEPGAIDPAVLDLARELARVVVARALDRRGELKLRTERDIRAVSGDLTKLLAPTDLRTDSVLAMAVTLLLVDAPRTIDLAVARSLAGSPEAAAFLSDGLGVLAAHASAAQRTSSGLTFALGKAREDGTTETIWAEAAQVGPDAAVRNFKIGGAAWEIVRGESGTVTEIRRGGVPATLSSLTYARIPVRDGEEWKANGLALKRTFGTPRVGIGPSGRVRVAGSEKLDVAAIKAPSSDVSIDTDLRVDGAPGGIVARASGGTSGFRGVGVVVEPNPRAGTMKVALRAFMDSTTGSDIGTPLEMKYSPAVNIKLTVKGTRAELQLASGAGIKGTLPPGLTTGDVALISTKGGSVEASGLVVRKN